MAGPSIFDPKITEHAVKERAKCREQRGSAPVSKFRRDVEADFVTAHLLMRAIRLTYPNVKCNDIQGSR